MCIIACTSKRTSTSILWNVLEIRTSQNVDFGNPVVIGEHAWSCANSNIISSVQEYYLSGKHNVSSDGNVKV